MPHCPTLLHHRCARDGWVSVCKHCIGSQHWSQGRVNMELFRLLLKDLRKHSSLMAVTQPQRSGCYHYFKECLMPNCSLGVGSGHKLWKKNKWTDCTHEKSVLSCLIWARVITTSLFTCRWIDLIYLFFWNHKLCTLGSLNDKDLRKNYV